MAKQDKFYYQNLVEAADISCSAAEYLFRCLSDYQAPALQERLVEMHRIEHQGDMKKHEMSEALARAFVTPVDREDLALISQNIDEVTDTIEEVLQRFYVNDIDHVTADCVAFAEKLVDCCKQMKAMVEEFENFKKPAKLHEMVVNLNHTEEECDQLYLESSLRICREQKDALLVYFWREIYEKMEKCADACEHVGDCVETVVMKNT